MPDNVMGDVTSKVIKMDEVDPVTLADIRRQQKKVVRTPTVTLTAGPAASTQLADFNPEHLMEQQGMVDPREVQRPSESDWRSHREW